jgi:hypothetical protein
MSSSMPDAMPQPLIPRAPAQDRVTRSGEWVSCGDRLLAMGQPQRAAESYGTALSIMPTNSSARRKLATLLVSLGRRSESLRYWSDEIGSGDDGRRWANHVAVQAMTDRDLSRAGDYAWVLAELRWKSPRYDLNGGVPVPTPEEGAPRELTYSKLRHDTEQFVYLRGLGIMPDEMDELILRYNRVINRLQDERFSGRGPIDKQSESEVGDAYKRIIHIRPTPRVTRALSGRWNPREVEARYIGTPPGVVVIDDFLSVHALEEVRRFCLESTVWNTNRYGHGRLGAFFHDGFNCPLLLQIAEELRENLPQVIGERYPLRQLWGFKNTKALPADATTHADFAAVNVNFWITPDDSNLDPASGGLVVYDVDAPLSWDFLTYNGRQDMISAFLRSQKSRAIDIPYRQNRAIIFNSDLFHGTAAVNFRPGYEDHRINVTMLYGDRENEVHHRHLARPEPGSATRAWRSAAFSRVRRAT